MKMYYDNYVFLDEKIKCNQFLINSLKKIEKRWKVGQKSLFVGYLSPYALTPFQWKCQGSQNETKLIWNVLFIYLIILLSSYSFINCFTIFYA